MWQIVRAPWRTDTRTDLGWLVCSPLGYLVRLYPLYSRPLLHASRAFQGPFSDEIVNILGKNLMQFYFHERLLMSTNPEELFAWFRGLFGSNPTRSYIRNLLHLEDSGRVKIAENFLWKNYQISYLWRQATRYSILRTFCSYFGQL